MDQPLDWHPEPDVLYQCSECDAIFAHPEALLLYGDWFYACPECHNSDMYALATEMVWGVFWHIIAHDFSLERRHTLRGIAEAYMEPFDPADRLR